MPEQFKLMIVVGEPSGDAHASALVNALHTVAPQADFQWFGATGPLLRQAGIETVVNSDELAIMGIIEVGLVLPRFVRAYRKLKYTALERRPDAVILVDWPEFNLRLATALHRHGIKVIYYISPQLWAWRPRRVKNIKRDVDLLLSILPFEAGWYQERGVEHVEFVGHPLAGEVKANLNRSQFCEQYKLALDRPIISFLPGSRRKELQRILPPMLEAVRDLQSRRPDLQFVIAVAPSRSIAETKQMFASVPGLNSDALRIVKGKTREVLGASDVAAVASGTATLEAALLQTPMVVVYKESSINWHTLGRLITIEHFGLVNLVAGERIMVELMQEELTGARLAGELLKLLDGDANRLARGKLAKVADKLGEPGASKRAAHSVLSALRRWS